MGLARINGFHISTIDKMIKRIVSILGKTHVTGVRISEMLMDATMLKSLKNFLLKR